MTDRSPLRPVSDEHVHVPADYEASPPQSTRIAQVEVSGRRFMQVFGFGTATVDDGWLKFWAGEAQRSDLVAAFVPGTWGSFTTDEAVVS